MNETRKAIIELIEPFMDKTLMEGCLIKTDGYIITILEEDEVTNDDELVIYRKYEDEFYCIDKIIGHYDITAVLKYIISIGNEPTYLTKVGGLNYLAVLKINYNGEDKYIDKFPNKPIHIYSEQEEKDLLETLLKLK